MKNIIYVLALFLCFSCGDFLEEYSQNSSYVETVDDLEELLLGEVYMDRDINSETSTGSMLYLHVMADESKELPIPNERYSVSEQAWENMFGFFTYAENPYITRSGVTRTDNDWALFYRRIAVINSIILSAPDYYGEDEEIEAQRLRVVGEAYYLRAWNYFMLANIYGAAYDKTNPNDAASVTLKLDPTVEDTKFGRANTGDVYGQIVADLQQAITYLRQGSIVTDSKVHVTTDAVFALLSRVYLYMEDYDLAIEAADSVTGYSLYDLVNEYTPGSGEMFLTTNQPEVIYAQGNYGMIYIHDGTGVLDNTNTALEVGTSYAVSEELEQLFDDNDARYSAFFTRSYGAEALVCRKYHPTLLVPETDPVTGDEVTPVVNGTDFNEIGSIRYAEVVLNKAEAQACSDDLAGATRTMQAFLQSRYYTAPTIPGEKNALIEFIRQERYKELCFEGHRWFDLRRYAVNTVHPQAITVTHEYHTTTTTEASVAGSYTLSAYDNTTKGSWIIPAPDEVINYCFPAFSNFDRLTGVTAN